MTTLDKAKLWLSETFDNETQEKVQQLIDSNSPDLEDSFYRE
jgi:phosphoglucomutase